MPKTRDAYWLENFDEKRILQRRYFKKFNLPHLSDAEILATLKVNDEDSVEAMEQKLSKVRALHDQAQRFNNKMLIRYSERLKKVHGKTYGDYLLACMSVAELIHALRKIYYADEGRIQKEYQKIFIERLKKYRKAAGLTLTKLGELTQVSPRGMSHYARGAREMPLHTLARVSKVLGVSADELLGLR
ncbi:MAG: helix-turn-helix transcriptional regulator [Selenomonadaceae bacterium]|nr:helix-turn-helix transcriptional regulator [Selenomonadaceae bacterium]